MKKIHPLTVAVILVGTIAGALLSVLATKYLAGTVVNVLLLTLGSGMISTALISLILDLFWSKERARAEGEELKPFYEKFESFANQLSKLEGRLEAFKLLGFNYCYPSRTRALERFLAYARQMIDGGPSGDHAPKKTINIVSSSARGLMGYLDRTPDEIQRQWRDLITKSPKSFRMLLTHPAYAHLRQPAEERASGAIELEILKSAIYLYLVAGAREDELRFYRGSPTVFAIQADTHILLNPYPYGQMAMETLCLEFESENSSSYVSNFMGKHFDHTWASIHQASMRVDNKPLVEGISSFANILEAFGECTFLGAPRQLRLTREQVQELEEFTTNNLKQHPKGQSIDVGFIQFVEKRGLSYSNPESGPSLSPISVPVRGDIAAEASQLKGHTVFPG